MSESERHVTQDELALEFRALRSDVKLWILAGVALNQFLNSVDIPPALTGAAILGVVVKGAISFVLAKAGGS